LKWPENMADCDGKVGVVGSAATLPMAAILLARLTVAPNLWCFVATAVRSTRLLTVCLKPAAHSRNRVGAEGMNAMMDVLEMGLRADWGFGFKAGCKWIGTAIPI